MLEQNGISPMTLASKLYEILSSKSVLISGYNVNFDLGFLFELAKKYDFKKKISNCDFLDIMTVFKDDKIQYPHKLNDALNYYKITDEANSHRAIDDTKATVAVLQEMLKKGISVEKYINVFGYNPKYYDSLNQLTGITYIEQPHANHDPIYLKASNVEIRSTKHILNSESQTSISEIRKFLDCFITPLTLASISNDESIIRLFEDNKDLFNDSWKKKQIAYYISDHFKEIIEGKRRQIITKKLYDYIVGNNLLKKILLPNYLEIYSETYEPDNDIVKIYDKYQEAIDNYFKGLIKNRLFTHAANWLENGNRGLFDESKWQQQIFITYLYAYKFEKAKQYFKEKYREYLDSFLKNYNAELHLYLYSNNDLAKRICKSFPEYSAFFLNFMFNYETSERRGIYDFNPDHYKTKVSEKEVIDYCEAKYVRDLERLQSARKADEKESKKLMNILSDFFSGVKKRKYHQFDDTKREVLIESKIYLIAMKYGFKLKDVDNCIKQYGKWNIDEAIKKFGNL